jgi:hypothetical protein
MSTPAFILITFAKNTIEFRRHWGGDPVINGSEMLDLLQSAETIKPRPHFHTGSWLLRLMFADGDHGGTSLPTYEAYDREDDVYGDWNFAYHFRCNVDGKWMIGLVKNCDGEPWSEIEPNATWYTPEEFRTYIDNKFVEDQKNGIGYDIQVREDFLRQLKSGGASSV